MACRPQLLEMTTLENEGKQRLAFLCPSRGLIGFRPAFATLTRGSGLMHRAFHEYGSFRGHMDRVRKGVLISMAGARRPRAELTGLCLPVHARQDLVDTLTRNPLSMLCLGQPCMIEWGGQ